MPRLRRCRRVRQGESVRRILVNVEECVGTQKGLTKRRECAVFRCCGDCEGTCGLCGFRVGLFGS